MSSSDLLVCGVNVGKSTRRSTAILVARCLKCWQKLQVRRRWNPHPWIEEAVDLFLKERRSSDEAVLTAVKTIVDLVSRLLQFEWDASREVVKEGLTNVLVAADGHLRVKVKEHRDVRNRLAEILEEELEKPWRIKLRSSAEVTMEALQSSKNLTFADWRSANVQWLCNSKFFAPSCCPPMLVGKQGVYESADHYMDTVHRLWVAMTFADGHAAMAPHCRSRGASGVGCNNALWPISGHLAGARCRTHGCSNEVAFACRIPKHDAFCGECATRSVARHLEKPGRCVNAFVRLRSEACAVGRRALLGEIQI
jgi:hypothetical protein